MKLETSSRPPRDADARPRPGRLHKLTGPLRQAADRMRNDLRLAIVTLYSLSLLVTVGGFSAYRAATGDLLIALVDALIVAAFVGLAALAWNPRWTRLATNIIAAIAALSVVTVVIVLGLSHQWVFSTLVGNYLLAERRMALAVNTTMVLTVALQPGTFATGTEQATFVAVAITVSLFSVIFSSRVHSQRAALTEMAERDGLTGAYNRRSLDRDLAALIERQAGTTQPMSVAVLDIDDFKRLNDEQGHARGDEVLVEMTEIVNAMTRDSDRFYRYGGEEFVLFMPGTALTGAWQAIDKLRQAVADPANSVAAGVTISAGIAEFRDGEDREAWLDRADQALLEAKRAGKNRVMRG